MFRTLHPCTGTGNMRHVSSSRVASQSPTVSAQSQAMSIECTQPPANDAVGMISVVVKHGTSLVLR